MGRNGQRVRLKMKMGKTKNKEDDRDWKLVTWKRIRKNRCSGLARQARMIVNWIVDWLRDCVCVDLTWVRSDDCATRDWLRLNQELSVSKKYKRVQKKLKQDKTCERKGNTRLSLWKRKKIRQGFIWTDIRFKICHMLLLGTFKIPSEF